jgi:hypothetical protein
VSKPRYVHAIERTCTMLDLVRSIYPAGGGMSLSHVVIEEVAPGTGWSAANRWADVLALSVWPSKGMTVDGYEIKASRADLKKELADPSKHQAVARYCDTWTLVVWDETVLLDDGIPEWWGILTTIEGTDETRELKEVRKAQKREPEPWPRAFVCSLVRNAFQQSPGAAYVARACVEAARRGRDDGRRAAESETYNLLAPLASLLYGTDRRDWPSGATDLENVVRTVTGRLTQGILGGSPAQEET